MKKAIFLLFVVMQFSIFAGHIHVTAEAKNKADTELCDTLTLALMSSLRKPIDQAVAEIYQSDGNAPDGLTWAPFQAELIEIEQVYGAGGLYNITLKIYPYYRAHITYGEDLVVVNSDGELLSYKHLQTYPKVDFLQ